MSNKLSALRSLQNSKKMEAFYEKQDAMLEDYARGMDEARIRENAQGREDFLTYWFYERLRQRHLCDGCNTSYPEVFRLVIAVAYQVERFGKQLVYCARCLKEDDLPSRQTSIYDYKRY